MKKEELFTKFGEMFPNWAKRAYSYEKIGTNVLAIKFILHVEVNKVEEESRVFLYKGPDDWHFGTKLYRKNPRNNKALTKLVKEEKKNEEN